VGDAAPEIEDEDEDEED